MMSLIDIDGDDASKYRLIGDRVLSYRFAVPHDAELYLGDILKITDSVKGLTFFAKVSDLLHDCNFSDPKWDTRPHTEHFYGIGEDVFILVEAVPLGYIGEDGEFRKPRTIPAKFSRVERPESQDFAFLRQVMGDIEVGVMKTGQGVLKDVRVALHSAVMRQHMGVFATTGMGKSNFMKVFCASCMRVREFGLLIVDPHGEYVAGGRSSSGESTRGLLHYQAGRDGLAVFSTRSEQYRKKYHLDQLFLDYDDFRMPDLLLLYEHSPPQREVVEMLESVPGSDVIDFFQGIDAATFDADTYSGPHRGIARGLKNFSASTLAVMQRRIAGMLNRNRGFFRRQGDEQKPDRRHRAPGELADDSETRGLQRRPGVDPAGAGRKIMSLSREVCSSATAVATRSATVGDGRAEVSKGHSTSQHEGRAEHQLQGPT